MTSKEIIAWGFFTFLCRKLDVILTFDWHTSFLETDKIHTDKYQLNWLDQNEVIVYIEGSQVQ